VCIGYLGSAHAERWSLDPSVTTRATWTDNAGFDDQSNASSDTLLEVTPAISLMGEGKRFHVRGTASFTELVYARGTRENRFLPLVDVTSNLEAIERLFFIDAGVVSRQGAEDAFAPRPDGNADINTVTTTQYQLTPRFEGRLGGDVRYGLRSSNSWTNVSGATTTAATGAYLGEHSMRVERPPSPFGFAVEATRSDTLFESGLAAREILDSARLMLPYAFSPSTRVALRGGYEKLRIRTSDRVSESTEQAIYGIDFDWHPTERTELSGLWEDRFFGNGWHLNFDHHMPRLAWTVSTSRDVASFPQSFLTLPPTNNVAALLDAAFTTRFPDAAERSRVVADLIARQGLPSSLATQTSLFSQRISLVTSANASIALIGVRNSLVISGFSSKTEDLPGSTFAFLSGINSVNVVQDGASVSLSRQVSSVLSFNVTGAYTRTRGIAADAGAQSRQKTIKGEMTRQLTAKSNAFVGARVQTFGSNVAASTIANPTGVATPPSAHEHAVFAGLTHRF
jgi:uncharacterized protein (PEP-CTERM system associated)